MSVCACICKCVCMCIYNIYIYVLEEQDAVTTRVSGLKKALWNAWVPFSKKSLEKQKSDHGARFRVHAMHENVFKNSFSRFIVVSRQYVFVGLAKKSWFAHRFHRVIRQRNFLRSMESHDGPSPSTRRTHL